MVLRAGTLIFARRTAGHHVTCNAPAKLTIQKRPIYAGKVKMGQVQGADWARGKAMMLKIFNAHPKW